LARLEVAAVKATCVVTVAQQPLPLLGRERQVDSGAVGVVGNVDGAKPAVCASFEERLMHLLGLSWLYPYRARWVRAGTGPRPSVQHRRSSTPTRWAVDRTVSENPSRVRASLLRVDRCLARTPGDRACVHDRRSHGMTPSPGDQRVANRSEIDSVTTPREVVEVARQQMQPLGDRKPWQWMWVARGRGQQDWRWASTLQEAIRQAALVSAGKTPPWLRAAVADAELQIKAAGADDAA
jgi:hypothetical protein